MTPSLKYATKLFFEIAEQKNIDLSKIESEWYNLIISATQICSFRSIDLLYKYLETALNHIPEKAIIK